MLGEYYPESLKVHPIWVLWRLEADNKGRPTKMPYSPLYHGHASSKDPKTWGTFIQAVQQYESQPCFYDGVAVCISRDYGLIFIDIDHCIDDDGVMDDRALDIIDQFEGQYMEISQSGTGIHILTKGSIPRSSKNSKVDVEMYADKRFCAMTGNPLRRGEPTEAQAAIDYVFSKYKTEDIPLKPVRSESVTLCNNDKWIISHASGHGRFDSLYAGQWQAAGYSSQSEADLALLMILSFWTNCNADQMDRLFRSSGLYRDKWERQDYRDRTLTSAISRCEHTLADYIDQKNREEGEAYDRAMLDSWDEL